jgi:hypothetical protein
MMKVKAWRLENWNSGRVRNLNSSGEDIRRTYSEVKLDADWLQHASPPRYRQSSQGYEMEYLSR